MGQFFFFLCSSICPLWGVNSSKKAQVFQVSVTAGTLTSAVLEKTWEAQSGWKQETWERLCFNLFFPILFLKTNFAKKSSFQLPEKESSRETPSGVNEENYINHSKFSMKLHCQPHGRRLPIPTALAISKDPLSWVLTAHSLETLWHANWAQIYR